MYDAIVIGSRCAGAPTAMLLARNGRRVLVVDRADMPSDTLSGHAIQPAGVARLKRWGLLERVRATGRQPPEGRPRSSRDGCRSRSRPGRWSAPRSGIAARPTCPSSVACWATSPSRPPP